MINNNDFAFRLKKVMDYHQLSASSFADKIKIPRSSISHLLSGRNKPSLDFVLKVIKEFETVDLYWFLNGKGNFPKTEPSPVAHIISQEENIIVKKTIPFSSKKTTAGSTKNIERIVIFYSDGTFKEYTP